jgi:hypothetical protein
MVHGHICRTEQKGGDRAEKESNNEAGLSKISGESEWHSIFDHTHTFRVMWVYCLMYLSSHSFERVLEFVQKEEMTARVSPD